MFWFYAKLELKYVSSRASYYEFREEDYDNMLKSLTEGIDKSFDLEKEEYEILE